MTKPTVCYRYNEDLIPCGFLFLKYGQYFGAPAPGYFKRDGCCWHERHFRMYEEGRSIAFMEEISEEQYDAAVVRHGDLVKRQCEQQQAPATFPALSKCPMGSILGGLF